MQYDISYCRILRKFVHNKNHYYLQIVFKSNPPVKVNTETGEVKHTIGSRDVGIDIGTSTVAISSDLDVKILELADKVLDIENQIRLLRKMDRSKRATNLNNFNKDGTILMV